MKKLESLKKFQKSILDAKTLAVVKGGYYVGCNTDCVSYYYVNGQMTFDNDLDCAACGRSDCGNGCA